MISYNKMYLDKIATLSAQVNYYKSSLETRTTEFSLIEEKYKNKINELQTKINEMSAGENYNYYRDYNYRS